MLKMENFNWFEIYWGVLASLSAFAFLTGREGDIKKTRKEKESIFHVQSRFSLYYLIALPFGLWSFYNAFTGHCLGWGSSATLEKVMDKFSTPHKPTTDSLSVVLALGLFTFQLTRRLYETMSVSIFSKTYIPFYFKLLTWVGLLSAGLCIIAEGPRIGSASSQCFGLSGFLRWNYLVGVVLFLWASKLHHDSHHHLARLRKNRAGHIVTTQYKMPKNGWFDTISCPHYLAEIVIYVGIWLVLGFPLFSSFTFYLLHVTFRELSKARATHSWYLQKFEDYPKERNAVLPFLM